MSTTFTTPDRTAQVQRILDRLCWMYNIHCKSRGQGQVEITEDQCLRAASRLWNAIDAFAQPEHYWGMMRSRCDWAFIDKHDEHSTR